MAILKEVMMFRRVRAPAFRPTGDGARIKQEGPLQPWQDDKRPLIGFTILGLV